MKPFSFLQTKFLIPQHTPDRLPRPRLENWLRDHQTKRLLLVSAPAGYGKTTLLSWIMRSARFQAAWYQLDAADNDPFVFLGYFVQALRRLCDAEFGNASLVLLETLDEEHIDLNRILTVLINEMFEAMQGRWTVVLEDYHLVSNPAVHKIVEYLLDNAPPELQLLISTRIDPPLQLARLRARDLLAELRASDLRFTPEETQQWFELKAPGISLSSVQSLARKTEGWAAGIQIVLSSIQGQDSVDAEAFIDNISGTHRYFFEYLAGEVFQRLNPEKQDFLLQTSVLEQMDISACNALLQRTDAFLILESLENANLFITSVSETQKWYRYHQLFREFLLGKLRRELPELHLQCQVRAAIYFESERDWSAAFSHYITASHHREAARILEGVAANFVEHGRVELLHRFLNQLDETVLRTSPELLLQRGNVLRRLGQAGAAITNYQDARHAFRKFGDRAGVCRALTQLATINHSQGHYRVTQSLATEALQHATSDDHAERARALMALAKSVGFLTGMDEGRALAEEAIQEANLAGDTVSPIFKANLLQSLGQICWWHGDPQATVRHCEDALQVLPERLSPIAAKAFISMVTPHLYWREFSIALQYAEQGLEIAQTLHLVELLPSAYAALGNVLTRLGETARAESSLRQAMETAQHLGLASYERLMATGFLAYNLAGQGRFDEAYQLAEGALWSYTGSPDTYEVYVCRSVLADIALEKNDLEIAERHFRNLVAPGQKHQFRIPLAMVYFGLAYICLKTGREDVGLKFAGESFRLIEPTKAFQLYIDQGPRSKLVCEALVGSGVSESFIGRVLDNLPDFGRRGPDLTVTDHKAIVVKMLGQFRILINGEEISQERWVSTKARDLLAYFITFRKERHAADRVFTSLWQDRAGSGKTAFHTALSRLRKALRQEEQTLKYILVEKGDYWLDAARFAVDVDQFDFALNKAQAAPDSMSAAEWLAHATGMVQGEYLENFYYDWVFPERRRLNREYLNALCRLAEIRAGNNEHEPALALIEKALNVDPLLESAHCQAMRSYAALDNRTAVVRQYHRLTELLKSELDIGPAPTTEALYNKLVSANQ